MGRVRERHTPHSGYSDAAAKLARRSLLDLLASEPVDSLQAHPAEVPLKLLLEDVEQVAVWLTELEEAGCTQVVADIMRLAGRLLGEGADSDDATRIVNQGLASSEPSVRDAAMELADETGHAAALTLVARHKEPVEWVRQLQGAVLASHGLTES